MQQGTASKCFAPTNNCDQNDEAIPRLRRDCFASLAMTFCDLGGEGGIRTHGGLLLTRFPIVPNRPLSHLSANGRVYYSIRCGVSPKEVVVPQYHGNSRRAANAIAWRLVGWRSTELRVQTVRVTVSRSRKIGWSRLDSTSGLCPLRSLLGTLCNLSEVPDSEWGHDALLVPDTRRFSGEYLYCIV